MWCPGLETIPTQNSRKSDECRSPLRFFGFNCKPKLQYSQTRIPLKFQFGFSLFNPCGFGTLSKPCIRYMSGLSSSWVWSTEELNLIGRCCDRPRHQQLSLTCSSPISSISSLSLSLFKSRVKNPSQIASLSSSHLPKLAKALHLWMTSSSKSLFLLLEIIPSPSFSRL